MAVSGKTKTAKNRNAAAKGKAAAIKKPAAAKKTVATKRPAVAKKTVPAKTVSGKKAVPTAKLKPKKKSPEKTGPHKDRLKTLRESLIKKRESIVKEAKSEIAKYISGEHRQLVDTALDDGDWAVVDISEDLNLLRLATHRKTLIDIDEALRKMAEGTYGICEECGEEISEKRLSIIPAATLCVGCKENRERLEAIEKEEIR